MIAQVRFALELYRHSGRWLAPLSLGMIWFLFAIGNAPNSLDTLAALFPAFLFVGCWVSISLGEIDDRSHREMNVAAAGSRGRLRLARAAASLVLCVALAAFQALYVSLVLAQPDRSAAAVAAVTMVTLLGASALGVAIGSLLHDPIVRSRAVSVGLSFGLAVAILLLPPVQNALQDLGTGAIGQGTTLAIVSLLVGAATTAGAVVATNRAVR